MTLLLLIMRFILGGVFIYSGFSKLIVPIENFVAVIEGYQFLKPQFVQPLAFILPWLELIFGVFLFTGFFSRLSAALLGFFAAIFVTLLTRSLILGLPITECGCFGAGISLAPKQAIFLDSGLFLMAACLTCFPPRLFSLDKKLEK